MLKKKKGQGLPLNTVIVAILVVLVLIVLVAFFLGGTTGLVKTVKKVFFGTTAGTDMSLAYESCKQYCLQAEGLPNTTWEKSAYCTKSFEIDSDNNGEADLCDDKEKYARYYCHNDMLNVPCSIDSCTKEDKDNC